MFFVLVVVILIGLKYSLPGAALFCHSVYLFYCEIETLKIPEARSILLKGFYWDDGDERWCYLFIYFFILWVRALLNKERKKKLSRIQNWKKQKQYIKDDRWQ